MAARFALRFARCRSGATAIEYGLIVSLIFLAVISGYQVFGSKTTNLFQIISDTVGGYM